MVRKSLHQRFWEKVDKNGPIPKHRPDLGECWIWTAAKYSEGYGAIMLNRKKELAHRVAFELENGSFPAGLIADHLCRNLICVNPSHIEPVLFGENIKRGDHHSRRKTHCPKGHEYTHANTYINPKGSRCCRACGRIRDYLRYQRRKEMVL